MGPRLGSLHLILVWDLPLVLCVELGGLDPLLGQAAGDAPKVTLGTV